MENIFLIKKSELNRNYATQNSKNSRKVWLSKKAQTIVQPPTEDTVKYLNRLGQQRPFCILYKQKKHDPL
jgi:hypothetical protein